METQHTDTKENYIIHAKCPGKLVMVGFGSIGQGTLPLILRHIDIDPKDITIISADTKGQEIAEKEGITFRVEPLNPQNFHSVLEPPSRREGGSSESLG